MRFKPLWVSLIGILLAVVCAGPASAQTRYGVRDAQYVTNSRNAAVLDYIVCLGNSVGVMPRNIAIPIALNGAEQICLALAQKLPRNGNEPNAGEIHQSILECGFRPGDASPDADCGVVANPGMQKPGRTASAPPPATARHQPDRVQRTPTVIAVGKWAEGIAFDGKWLWAAESGIRTVAKIDFNSGRVVERIKVGRLPTDMVSTGDGNVFAMVATDKKIWSQTGRGRRATLARLSECPEAMIADGNDLWALTLPDCSSDKSRVIRIDSRGGRQTQSPVLGQWAIALVAHRGLIWVAHAREPALTIVDKASMRATAINTGGASLWSIAGNSAHVFGGGRVDGSTDDGLVVKFNPANFSVLARATVPQRVAKIICDEDFVVAFGDKGTIWVFSAGDLKLQRTIDLSTGAFEPRAAAFHEDSILVSSGKYRGENGAVFIIGNWRPDAAQQAATPVGDPVAPARGQRIFPSFDCARANSTAERVICANNQLASLDKAMATEYAMAFGNITSAAVGGTVADALAFKREQRAWLRKRDNCRGDEDCLFAAYQSRLRVIEKMNQPE